MDIEGLDHIVLTVASITKTLEFYCGILGMKEMTFNEGRKAVIFGKQKINLHETGNEYEPKAFKPTPGSADLCFLVNTPLFEIIKNLKAKQQHIIEGPIERTGACGKIISIYLRDPDQNLIELANCVDPL